MSNIADSSLLHVRRPCPTGSTRAICPNERGHEQCAASRLMPRAAAIGVTLLGATTAGASVIGGGRSRRRAPLGHLYIALQRSPALSPGQALMGWSRSAGGRNDPGLAGAS